MGDLSAADFDEYILATHEIEAQSVLNMVQAFDMPHMKKEDRAERFSKLQKMGYPIRREGKPMSAKQLAARLSGAIK